MFADPAGYVLRRRIDIQHIVDILVVESILDDTLDLRKIGNHTVGIEFFGLAINGYNPVMSVQLFALALITELEVVRSRDCECFLFVKYILFFRYF